MKTSIVDLPFQYEIEFTAVRKRAAESMQLRGMTPVRLRSFTSEEAPVGLEIDGPYNVKQIYRVVDGRMFQPLVLGKSISRETFLADCDRTEGWHQPVFVPGRPSWHVSDYPNVTGRTSPIGLPTMEMLAGSRRLKSVNASDREAAEAKTQELLSSVLVVIDGEIWKTPAWTEPRYVVSREGFSSPEGERVSIKVVTGGATLPGQHNFRLDRFDDAHAFAEQLASLHKLQIDDKRPQMTLRRPDALIRDDVLSIGRQVAETAAAMIRAGKFEPDAELRRLGQMSHSPGQLTLERSLAAIAKVCELVDGKARFGKGTRYFVDEMRDQALRWRFSEQRRHVELVAFDETRAADEAAIMTI